MVGASFVLREDSNWQRSQSGHERVSEAPRGPVFGSVPRDRFGGPPRLPVVVCALSDCPSCVLLSRKQVAEASEPVEPVGAAQRQ